MSKFELFTEIREGAVRGASSVSNCAALGLSPETRSVHVLWMYPNVLNLHGGRGDAMALLHFSNCMSLPCTLRRINTLSEEIPFDWADLILFQSGDLDCMADLCRALTPKAAEFAAFAENGGVILAVGSSGSLLARNTKYLDGTQAPGLGLLGMEMTQRTTIHGDDLWFTTREDLEIVASQIQRTDVALDPDQAPLGTVTYGRGNCGDGREGARTGTVFFTHCVGPVLVRNPRFAALLLKLAAAHAGIPTDELADEDIALELEALRDTKGFIEKKLSKDSK